MLKSQRKNKQGQHLDIANRKKNLNSFIERINNYKITINTITHSRYFQNKQSTSELNRHRITYEMQMESEEELDVKVS